MYLDRFKVDASNLKKTSKYEKEEEKKKEKRERERVTKTVEKEIFGISESTNLPRLYISV